MHLDGIVPDSHETVLSQLAHRHFGGGLLYGYTQAATALILVLAANTAFNDFPRVMYLLARDRFVARRYLRLGDRLAFSNGMIALALAAGVLFVVFAGRTQSLIPLYAVGVFLAFTLSQAGMVVHWWRLRTSAVADEHPLQRVRLRLLGGRARRRRGHQVHRGRLGRAGARARVHRREPARPTPLRRRR